MASSVPDVIVIGCGASGALLCMQLFRQARRSLNVTCIEPRARLGAGLAYGTLRDEHLLNVPASKMSAWPDQPAHFAQWLDRRRLAERTPDRHFARRRDYADYLTDSMGESLRTSGFRHGFHHEPNHAVRIVEWHGGWLVNLEDGSELWARQVVLAIGNLPAPLPPRGLEAIVADPGYVHDPWAQSIAGPGLEGSVAVIGSGLTAIDQIMTLDALNHRGAIIAISRHGGWPGAHIIGGTPAHVDIGPSSPASMARRLRARIAEHSAAGGHWQEVIDGLRQQTPVLWGALTETERRKFCRHLQSFWNRARHRMPPEVAERLSGLLNSGQLSLRKARQLRAEPVDGRIKLDIGQSSEPLMVDRVINCTGASVRVADSRQPLLSHALGSGLLAPGPAGLGLLNDVNGELINPDGMPNQGLFTIGPMRQGTLWESTAIPELRTQAEQLAAQLLRRI